MTVTNTKYKFKVPKQLEWCVKIALTLFGLKLFIFTFSKISKFLHYSFGGMSTKVRWVIILILIPIIIAAVGSFYYFYKLKVS